MSLSQDDLNDLRYAKDLLENPSLAAKLTNFIGIPLEQGFDLLPKKLSEIVSDATQKSLETALEFAVMTLDEGHGQQSANMAHKLLVAAAGAGAGALGLPALAVELPVSTTIMLRSIAEIARSEGEESRPTGCRMRDSSAYGLRMTGHQNQYGEILLLRHVDLDR